MKINRGVSVKVKFPRGSGSMFIKDAKRGKWKCGAVSLKKKRPKKVCVDTVKKKNGWAKTARKQDEAVSEV